MHRRCLRVSVGTDVLRRRLREPHERSLELRSLWLQLRQQSGLRRRTVHIALPRGHHTVWPELREHLERQRQLRHLRCDLHWRPRLLRGGLCLRARIDFVRWIVHQHCHQSKELRCVPPSLSRQPRVRDERLHGMPLFYRRDVLRALRRHDDLERELRRVRCFVPKRTLLCRRRVLAVSTDLRTTNQ